MPKLTSSQQVSQELVAKAYKEFDYNPKTGEFEANHGKLGEGTGGYGKLRDGTGNYGKPLHSRNTPLPSPFHFPALEKTYRQASTTTGYKASAAWQTASLLRDLLVLWMEDLPVPPAGGLPLFSRLKAQLLDAARSTVSTIEEGYARPTTKEYLDYLGFSQASLAEIRGDIERCHSDGLLKPGELRRENTGSALTRSGIPTPSRNFPYPPVSSRANPTKYGSLREKLREYTGKNLTGADLTYKLFIELINKTNYLLNQTVTSLQTKMIRTEQAKLNHRLTATARKHW